MKAAPVHQCASCGFIAPYKGQVCLKCGGMHFELRRDPTITGKDFLMVGVEALIFIVVMLLLWGILSSIFGF